jgi:hypothetical protein
MVDGLHILIRNRTMKPLVIALITRGRDGEGNRTNV